MIQVIKDVNTSFKRHIDCKVKDPKSSLWITLKNKNRVKFNAKARAAKGYVRPIERDEVIMVVKNSMIYPAFNSELFYVRELYDIEVISHQPRGKDRPTDVHLQDALLEPVDGGDAFHAKLCLNTLNRASSSLTTTEKQVLVIDYKIREREGDSNLQKDYQDSKLNPLLVSYAYAITCHKAQGQEAENVFVHIERDWDMNPNNGFMRRWMYTALSRTRKNLTIVNSKWV